MLNPNAIFPQTENLISQEEIDKLDKYNTDKYEMPSDLSEDGTHIIPEEDASLLEEGFISNIFHGTTKRYYLPDKVKIKTFQFKFPIIKTIEKKGTENGEREILNTEESNKRGYLTKFIAFWICGKSRINIIQKAKYIFLYTYCLPCVISIPDFMFAAFATDAAKVGIRLKEITPPIRNMHCNFCGNNFTQESHESERCPKCGCEAFEVI